jgi:hypothetical protein
VKLSDEVRFPLIPASVLERFRCILILQYRDWDIPHYAVSEVISAVSVFMTVSLLDRPTNK